MKILLILIVLLSQIIIYGASFDCKKAYTKLEKSICSNQELSKLDKYMSEYYFKIQTSLDKKSSKKLLSVQRKWLKNREKECKSLNTSCLTKYYKKRIFELRKKYENLSEYKVLNIDELQGIRNGCKFEGIEFPDDMIVYAGGAYKGRKIKYQIDQSGHQATQFEVIVNSPDKPVALILGAYEPSIWNIAWTKGTYIKAVFVTGYHRQVVAGLPNDIPILNSSYHNGSSCSYMYISNKYLKQINPLSNKIYGRNVKMVYYAKKGNIIFGKQLTRSIKLYTSKDNPPSSFIDKSKPLAGEAGLEDLVLKGMLRRVTSLDLDRWARLKEKDYTKMLQSKNEELPPVANAAKKEKIFRPIYVHNSYVILKKITIPTGLYGAHSATFFLEKGVAYPDGDLGHSTLYDFNTMKCIGIGCNI